jgi:acyl-CoA reductase-like NAD-dependent aldehyde dehydrogenase
MGKPILQSLNEIKGMNQRINSMINMAPKVLERKVILENENGYLAIEREPIGNVLIISPWNYPLLTTVNTLIPSILAGNSVLIKHSPYTPYCGEIFQIAAEESGVSGVVQNCMVDIATCQHLLSHPEINYVSFTGRNKNWKGFLIY